jgi:hypothetical protein
MVTKTITPEPPGKDGSVQPASEKWKPFVKDGEIFREYEFQLIPLKDLNVDYHASVWGTDEFEEGEAEGYQRLQNKVANKVVKDNAFNTDLFMPLTVNQRPDGSYWVVDGGTRNRMLNLMEFPPDTLVPALVHKWDPIREIQNYVSLNKERAGLTSVDLFVAKVQYKDEQSTAIQETLLEISGHGVHKNKGGWQCVSALESAYKTRKNLAETIQLIEDLDWRELPKGNNQHVVNAVSRVLAAGANPKRAKTAWTSLSPLKVYNDAVKLGNHTQNRGIGRVMALLLADRYNLKLKEQNKIDAAQFLVGSSDDD